MLTDVHRLSVAGKRRTASMFASDWSPVTTAPGAAFGQDINQSVYSFCLKDSSVMVRVGGGCSGVYAPDPRGRTCVA